MAWERANWTWGREETPEVVRSRLESIRRCRDNPIMPAPSPSAETLALREWDRKCREGYYGPLTRMVRELSHGCSPRVREEVSHGGPGVWPYDGNSYVQPDFLREGES